MSMKNQLGILMIIVLVATGFSCTRRTPPPPVPATPVAPLPGMVLPPSTITGDIDVQEGTTQATLQYASESGLAPTEHINPDTQLRIRGR